ncbi:hypothetical protein C8Q76DRAFT_728656 [Earliella scabrosa]|nr:hypothetical protein C8Q76DRAFT_728656 [Earliella scabrosa]
MVPVERMRLHKACAVLVRLHSLAVTCALIARHFLRLHIRSGVFDHDLRTADSTARPSLKSDINVLSEHAVDANL